MAALLTIPETIEVGKVSVYLAGNSNSLGALYGKRLAAPTSPVTIAMATDALIWGYEGNPADSGLRSVANYLVWLCGRYSLEAQYIISGSGGGTVVPIGGNRYEWYSFVGSVGSGQDNSTTYVNSLFVGALMLNTFTLNGGALQTDPANFTFTSASGEIEWAPNKFFDGDVIAAQFYRKIS